MIVDFKNLSLERNKTLPTIRTNNLVTKFKNIEIRNFTANEGLSCEHFRKMYSMNQGELSLKLVNVDLSKANSHNRLFSELTLSRLEFENVTCYGRGNYSKYFLYSSIGKLVINKFELVNAVDLYSMFEGINISKLNSIGIEDWCTTYVTKAAWCFCAADAGILDLSKWDTGRLKQCKGMFLEFVGDELILDWANMPKEADMQKMFEYSTIGYLSMRGMNLETALTNLLFKHSKIKVLDLTDVKLPGEEELTGFKMRFNSAEIDYIVTNNTYFIHNYKSLTILAAKLPTIVTSLSDLPLELRGNIHRRI